MGQALAARRQVIIHFAPGILGPGGGEEAVLRQHRIGMLSCLVQEAQRQARLALLIIQGGQGRQRAGIVRIVPQRPCQVLQRTVQIKLHHAHHGSGHQQAFLFLDDAQRPADSPLSQRPVPTLPGRQRPVDHLLFPADFMLPFRRLKAGDHPPRSIALRRPGRHPQLVVGTVQRRFRLVQRLQASGHLQPYAAVLRLAAHDPRQQLRRGLPVAGQPQFLRQCQPCRRGILLLCRPADKGQRVQRLTMAAHLRRALPHPAAGEAEGIDHALFVLIHQRSLGRDAPPLSRGRRGPAAPSDRRW